MIVFYYDKKQAEQGILFCLGQENKILTQEEIKKQGKSELYKNVVTYTGETVLVGYPIVEGDTVRNATDKELIDKGIITLREGEILEGDNIKKIPQPSWQYKWESPNWIIDESKLQSGEIIENGKIKYIAPPDNLIVPKWISPNWVEGATDLEKVQYKFNQYEVLNNPADWEEMELAGVLEDWKTFRKENKTYLQRAKQGFAALIDIPIPSEKLKEYFNNNANIV